MYQEWLMSSKKRRPSKAQPQSKGNALIVLGVGILVIVAALVVGGMAAASPDTPTVGAAAMRGGLISPAEYVAQFSDVPHLLLDVRTVGEFQSGHIAGAANIPVEELSRRLAEVPKELPVVLYCRSGNRSAHAARILRSAGYEVVYDLGGLIAWQAQGYPIQR
jgi:rhodanese-related sulfurtransferase